jgi:hypothetical protein
LLLLAIPCLEFAPLVCCRLFLWSRGVDLGVARLACCCFASLLVVCPSVFLLRGLTWVSLTPLAFLRAFLLGGCFMAALLVVISVPTRLLFVFGRGSFGQTNGIARRLPEFLHLAQVVRVSSSRVAWPGSCLIPSLALLCCCSPCLAWNLRSSSATGCFFLSRGAGFGVARLARFYPASLFASCPGFLLPWWIVVCCRLLSLWRGAGLGVARYAPLVAWCCLWVVCCRFSFFDCSGASRCFFAGDFSF